MKGEGGRGPNLRTGVFFHGGADADLFRNITDGITGTAMPGVFFSPDQVWQAKGIHFDGKAKTRTFFAQSLRDERRNFWGARAQGTVKLMTGFVKIKQLEKLR